MYNKCCVDNCQSQRKYVKLHQFPASPILLRKWLQCINSERLWDLSLQELRKLYVCHKHFERKVITEKSRICLGAYPTLLSEEEIRSGLPSVAHKDENKENMLFDHCYSNRRQHEDHTYYSKIKVISFETEVNPKTDHSYFKNRHEDHTYCKFTEHLAFIRNNDHSYSKKRHNDHTYVKLKVETLNFSRNDQDTNSYPEEFNPPLSNNDAVDTGEPRQNEKTEVDCRKPCTGSKKFPSDPYAEGIPDFDDSENQESTFQNLQGSKSAQNPIFSWEKNVEDVPADDGDAVVYLDTKPAVVELPPEISLYCDDDSNPENDLDKAQEYQCNECQEVISGFRYTCVQCADWDLCAACEARAAHATHYVLRVPGQRPYSEIQAVLAAIRQQILSENLFLNPVDDSLKMEIKSESGEEPPDLDPESAPPLDLDSLPDLELLPDLDPLPVPDPLDGRPNSEDSFTDSSEESDNYAASPNRAETPNQEYTQTEYLESSSDDSDASQSPPRKRKCTTPIETHEEVTHEPVAVQNTQDIERLASYIIQPRDKIDSRRRDLTKVHPNDIPQDILGNLSITSKSLKLVHPSRENAARFNQRVTRSRPNPASLLIQHQKIIEEPVVSIPQQMASTFVPSILKRGKPRKLDLVDSTMHRTDYQRQVVVESEQTFYLDEFSELILDPHEEISEVIQDSDEENSERIKDLEGISERVQDAHVEENVEQLNEPSEFCLRLPAGTHEESLIQALQCPVTVRLKRDF